MAVNIGFMSNFRCSKSGHVLHCTCRNSARNLLVFLADTLFTLNTLCFTLFYWRFSCLMKIDHFMKNSFRCNDYEGLVLLINPCLLYDGYCYTLENYSRINNSCQFYYRNVFYCQYFKIKIDRNKSCDRCNGVGPM